MFFIFAFENLLNIHHYFIDNLIWRSSQSDVKSIFLHQTVYFKWRDRLGPDTHLFGSWGGIL